MTYENLEFAMEQSGYNIDGLTAEEVEAIAEVEGYKMASDDKYYFTY